MKLGQNVVLLSCFFTKIVDFFKQKNNFGSFSISVPHTEQNSVEMFIFCRFKLPKLQAVWAWLGLALLLLNWGRFCNGPWLYVSRFIAISNVIELREKLGNLHTPIFEAK